MGPHQIDRLRHGQQKRIEQGLGRVTPNLGYLAKQEVEDDRQYQR